jgi:hypothetical protein
MELAMPPLRQTERQPAEAPIEFQPCYVGRTDFIDASGWKMREVHSNWRLKSLLKILIRVLGSCAALVTSSSYKLHLNSLLPRDRLTMLQPYQAKHSGFPVTLHCPEKTTPLLSIWSLRMLSEQENSGVFIPKDLEHCSISLA